MGEIGSRVGIKVCTACQRVNKFEEKRCHYCGNGEFDEDYFTAYCNSAKPQCEKIDENHGTDTGNI